MKNKVLMVLMCLTLTLSMVLGILAGCTPATTTPGATTAAPTKTTPGATAKPTVTAAPTPTKAGEQLYWRAQSTSSAGVASYWTQKQFCDDITTASGGRLTVELFPGGAIVSRNETMEAVAAGSIELTPTCSDNDSGGIDMRYEIGNIPAGMSQWIQICWMRYTTDDDRTSPYDKLIGKLYEERGIKAFPAGSKGPEVGYMANKKIIKPTDYKGLTFRGAGWELELLENTEWFGAKPVYIPSSDVYTAIQTGVIDAFEVGDPAGNWSNGYQDVTKYWGFPGMNNLCQTSSGLVNMEIWNSLPADLQKIVQMAYDRQLITSATFNIVESAKTIQKLVDVGIQLVYLQPEVHQQWRDYMLKSIEVREAKEPGFKAAVNEALEFQYTLERYLDLQTPHYMDPNYPGAKESLPGFVWE